MKIKYKIFLQFILLIVLVSGAIIGTTLELSEESKQEVLEEVGSTLRHLQDVSRRGLDDAREVAYSGIKSSSGLGAIDQLYEITHENQKKFFRLVEREINLAGQRIAETLASQNREVEQGLDALLFQITRDLEELVSMDRLAFGVISEAAGQNVAYLQRASQAGLERLRVSRAKLDTEQKRLARKNLDELDTLLTGIIRENGLSPIRERELAERFLEVKRSISNRQEHFFDEVFRELDLQRRVLGGEIDLVASNVSWSVEQEKNTTVVGQQRRIAAVQARLQQQKGRLHYRIDQLALAMRKTINELRTTLPAHLKGASDETNAAIGEQVRLAKQGASLAQERVTTRIVENTDSANLVFETAIRASREAIDKSFAQAQAKTTRLSILIVLGSSLLALALGFVMIRNLTKPIGRVLYFAEKMASGDLSQRLEEGTDEMGEMGRALNRMADDLEKLQRATIEGFNDTLDKVLDCIFMFDPDTLQFIYVNQGAVDHLGFTREQLLTMTPLDIKPEFTEESFRQMTERLRSGQQESETFITVHRDVRGEDIPVEVLLRHVTPPGNEPRFVAVVRDITERIRERKEKEQMQAELLHSQKLESVGQLAAGIAHEINTPTQFIGTNIEFMADTVADLETFFQTLQTCMQELPEKHRKQLEEALEELDWEYLEEELPQAVQQSREGVDRVTSIVAAMKRFSHPGSQEKTPSDLHEVITTALTVSRNEWKYVADAETRFDPDLPPVPLYSDQFGQVVLNMMVNAAHAIEEKQQKTGSEAKGRIVISTKNLGDRVELVFEDNGMGIAPEIIKKVFDPFFTTKEVGKGTGQGLAISHDVITRKHGGTIEVSSNPGEGTRFRICLPLSG